MRPVAAFALLLALTDCVDEPQAAAPVSPHASVSPWERGAVTGRQYEGLPQTEPDRVLVLETTKLDRYAEVVGMVDVHEPMGSDQAALARLREKAATMGADAVVGVEFHHGDGEGEPTHLSGMAVRFVAAP